MLLLQSAAYSSVFTIHIHLAIHLRRTLLASSSDVSDKLAKHEAELARAKERVHELEADVDRLTSELAEVQVCHAVQSSTHLHSTLALLVLSTPFNAPACQLMSAL
jgi:hypothetical protein